MRLMRRWRSGRPPVVPRYNGFVMKEVLGTVENGVVKLPASVSLPDGSRVRVLWDEDSTESRQPLEREAIGEEEVKHEVEWATGKRFEGG